VCPYEQAAFISKCEMIENDVSNGFAGQNCKKIWETKTAIYSDGETDIEFRDRTRSIIYCINKTCNVL
jgi:hypothetical protein